MKTRELCELVVRIRRRTFNGRDGGWDKPWLIVTLDAISSDVLTRTRPRMILSMSNALERSTVVVLVLRYRTGVRHPRGRARATYSLGFAFGQINASLVDKGWRFHDQGGTYIVGCTNTGNAEESKLAVSPTTFYILCLGHCAPDWKDCFVIVWNASSRQGGVEVVDGWLEVESVTITWNGLGLYRSGQNHIREAIDIFFNQWQGMVW